MYIYKRNLIAVLYNGRHNIPTKQHKLSNKTFSTRNGLYLFELMTKGFLQTIQTLKLLLIHHSFMQGCTANDTTFNGTDTKKLMWHSNGNFVPVDQHSHCQKMLYMPLVGRSGHQSQPSNNAERYNSDLPIRCAHWCNCAQMLPM